MPEKTIQCTPENARQFQQIVKGWPELHRLVIDLQSQGLFPGLRAMEITVTGSPEYVAKGLDAAMPENGS